MTRRYSLFLTREFEGKLKAGSLKEFIQCVERAKEVNSAQITFKHTSFPFFHIYTNR